VAALRSFPHRRQTYCTFVRLLAWTVSEPHDVATPTLRAVATAVVERRAPFAYRYASGAELAAVNPGMVEAAGAQLGAGILHEFPESEA
jgi:hypothetical protein